ncbi:putative molybdopterin biosynthesis protein [Natranaerovirga pectinivora]|uniref:Putative molybdopterin biosynthesis protein n=1 Tax=Natranaerovirga pectinivora TaxID=682400 RepID=A0A4R3MRF3_9FIRM|nr:helix-turn-helix transcriptional regulator [Natranaerovirga pectinivora]TCT16768.1 putative molybdopterin biosynthesis protein [Natranaerovirga pectinivora]
MDKNTALTTQEVADMLKIAKNTVYELIKRGELNSYRVGRKVRIELKDVESYISNSKTIKEPNETDENNELPTGNTSSKVIHNPYGGLVICGQDLILDILSNYIKEHPKGAQALRAYIGSYNSLTELYYGNVQVATAHLWDGDTGEYNIPYVRRLLPGIPAVIIHLTYRMQGFYVAKGNPKNINTWSDLSRQDITIINREKGAGSRVLLDEHLRLLGIKGNTIKGYTRESHSHLTAASTVGRGGADVAVGYEKIASQVNSVDFIPLQKERYELVIKKEDMETPGIIAMLEILNSDKFKMEFKDIGGYEISEMGNVVAEI